MKDACSLFHRQLRFFTITYKQFVEDGVFLIGQKFKANQARSSVILVIPDL